ncbi:hypothetical protein AMAG_02421 [Allomyces macrogynus ATCC 38327]|uniref:SAP domain-containing protein n=1 Tax=Allomyces macrogynus (strain ATCC 38327) TaxID=578462 RepID=A0A0L0S253_ALLM3|nr:hypothetical protein AMAG_02421 [Allomyces macrogynus ATCC 38327]|eukprot:KNE56633.1 hypothetical protein AMAG_02421 [Allomyces macrogynus ATCC 38327]
MTTRSATTPARTAPRTPVQGTPAEADLRSFKRPVLQRLCKELQIKASGKNTELVDRLLAHYQSTPSSAVAFLTRASTADKDAGAAPEASVVNEHGSNVQPLQPPLPLKFFASPAPLALFSTAVTAPEDANPFLNSPTATPAVPAPTTATATAPNDATATTSPAAPAAALYPKIDANYSTNTNLVYAWSPSALGAVAHAPGSPSRTVRRPSMPPPPLDRCMSVDDVDMSPTKNVGSAPNAAPAVQPVAAPSTVHHDEPMDVEPDEAMDVDMPVARTTPRPAPVATAAPVPTSPSPPPPPQTITDAVMLDLNAEPLAAADIPTTARTPTRVEPTADVVMRAPTPVKPHIVPDPTAALKNRTPKIATVTPARPKLVPRGTAKTPGTATQTAKRLAAAAAAAPPQTRPLGGVPRVALLAKRPVTAPVRSGIPAPAVSHKRKREADADESSAPSAPALAAAATKRVRAGVTAPTAASAAKAAAPARAGSAVTAGTRPKFDLQASLKRGLGYKPHKGPLKK